MNMTLSIVLDVVALLAAVLVGIHILGWRAATRSRKLERFEHWSRRFYTAAQILVDDPETPNDTLVQIRCVNRIYCHRDKARLIYEVLLEMIASPPSNPKDRTEADIRFEEIMDRREDLAAAFSETYASSVLAASYIVRHGGEHIRAMLAELLGKQQSAPRSVAAHDVRRVLEVKAAPLVLQAA